jgi:hypothetical protein
MATENGLKAFKLQEKQQNIDIIVTDIKNVGNKWF